MKFKVDKTVAASVVLHVIVLGAVLLSFSTRALEVHPEETVGVDISDEPSAAAGMKTGKKENPKPLVEKVAEAKPVEDTAGKISPKQPVVTETAPAPQPKVEEKPVEKKPDPPKVVEKKEEPKPDEKKPEPAVDPIAEAIKKEPKKPTPPKPVQAAKPPEEKKIKERHFDQSQIAALIDKRDPARQAITGDTLNSNAALGTANGKAANNSATWGRIFEDQVNNCWKKPYGGIEAPKIIAEFDIRLKRDGSLEATPKSLTTPTTAYHRVFLESGLRAILECAPYRLPAAYFEEWRAFIPTFKSDERG